MSNSNVIPEAACKSSNLNSRMKSGIIKKYKPFYTKLYQHSKSGVARLELFADEKSSVSGVPMFVIVAAEVIKVAPCGPLSSDEEFAFQIHTKEQINLFSAKTAKERDDWVTMIQNVFFQTPIAAANAVAEQEVTSENDIYVSADEVTREFLVTVGAETRTKLGFDGMVRLLVEDGHITLIGKAGNRLTRWGVEHLRRFGYRANDFHLEAGRKSMSGEGTFTFVTAQGKQIHSMVTKEKQRTRSSFKSGQIPSMLPVGQVPPPEPPNAPTLTIGGHIYEEMPVGTPNKIIPNKPPRQTGPTPKANFDVGTLNQVPEIPRPMNFANIKSPRTNGATSESEGMPRVAQGLPTMKAEGRPPVSTGAVYEEPELITNAWRTHGRDVDDQPIVESTYDNLQRYPQTNIATESHYASSPIAPWSKVDRKMLSDLRTQQKLHQSKVEHIVVNQDATYAVIQPRTQRNQDPVRGEENEPNPDNAF